jgi:hypothetical protein
MAKNLTSSLLLALLLLISNPFGVAAQERELLYAKSMSGKLREITVTIRNLKSEVTPCQLLTRNTDYYVRIAPRKYILTENRKLKEGARLGAKPFVFVTTPESVFGLSLLDIYLGIGYEAEDVMRTQRDEDMVLIVFKYPPENAASGITNGLLPDDWGKKIYIPTWENIFSLFEHLAAVEPAKQKELPFERVLAMSQAEREFVLGFPVEAKHRITKSAYAELKAAGGLNWKYRELLEQKLSIFEHFRGTGYTQNEVRDPEGVETGLIEFVAPNLRIEDFPEAAIIHLGQLTMKDSYGGGCNSCRSLR